MITRIVKMTFLPETAAEFEALYYDVEPQIEAMEGCRGVRLMRDTGNPALYFTLSTWDTADHLNAYRTSPLFISTWAKTKTLFGGRPEAWSTVEAESGGRSSGA